jgi:tetratricopeptide (TPR) repeat protein
VTRPDRREELLLERLRLDERPGPARRISRDQAQSLIDDALSTWEGERMVPDRRGVSLWQTLSIAAGLLLAVVGGASAARWLYERAPEPAPAQVERARAAKQPRTVLPAVRVEPEAAVVVEVEAPEPRAPKSRAAERSEPDDLLQKANQLRAEGRFQAAAETYAHVYERYPRSLSAYAAQVAAASLELEHLGRPLRAQKLFESALHAHPTGALDLEARQGLALSLRDLGKRHEEVRALRALIAAHEASPAARRAEARLKELSGSAP